MENREIPGQLQNSLQKQFCLPGLPLPSVASA